MCIINYSLKYLKFFLLNTHFNIEREIVMQTNKQIKNLLTHEQVHIIWMNYKLCGEVKIIYVVFKNEPLGRKVISHHGSFYIIK